jgi:putative PIN family toxin of toxin-antitoxin system
LRVIIDTNPLLSALIRQRSVPAQLVQAWLEDRFTLLTHETQLDEFRDTSRRSRLRARILRSDAGKLVNRIRKRADIIDRLPNVHRSADPKDDFLLALCEAGRADYLVTGDKTGLLALGMHRGTTILTARAFLDLLGR